MESLDRKKVDMGPNHTKQITHFARRIETYRKFTSLYRKLPISPE